MNRLTGIIAVMLIAALAGCRENPIRNSEGVLSESPTRIPDSPQDLLIGTLDELIRISEGLPNGRLYGGGRTLLLRKGAADTTYVYGELTPEGYGAVVTERHTYPRGIPLITVRKTYGKENNVIVSDLRRYTSLADLLGDRPEQAVLTEVSGLLQDTILTRITRNTGIETHTFRLPVVTVTLKNEPGMSRQVTRYALATEILVETRDGNGQMLQLRRNSTLADGSLIATTEYPDGSWRRTRTVGRSDGTILRETASSE